jgi:isoquinoline 1-oxidoreductase subunit alpha
VLETYRNLQTFGSRELIALTVNGERVHIDAADDIPLLWVLRDTPNLTGTGFGCRIAQCGACTVYANGKARRSCVVRLASVAGRASVTTRGRSQTTQREVR